MSRIRRYLPRPALVLGVVALLAATAGTSYAIGQFGVGQLREGARQKVVGVGKLIHVTTPRIDIPVTTVADPITNVKATCPDTLGNLQPIAGGIRLNVDDPDFMVLDEHHIDNGWAGTVYNNTARPRTAQVTLACARSIAVTGLPPAS